MLVSEKQVQIHMAKALMNPYDLCKEADIQYKTLRRILNGGKAKPATIGKIAKALNIQVEELLEDEPGVAAPVQGE